MWLFSSRTSPKLPYTHSHTHAHAGSAWDEMLTLRLLCQVPALLRRLGLLHLPAVQHPLEHPLRQGQRQRRPLCRRRHRQQPHSRTVPLRRGRQLQRGPRQQRPPTRRHRRPGIQRHLQGEGQPHTTSGTHRQGGWEERAAEHAADRRLLCCRCARGQLPNLLDTLHQQGQLERRIFSFLLVSSAHYTRPHCSAPLSIRPASANTFFADVASARPTHARARCCRSAPLTLPWPRTA